MTKDQKRTLWEIVISAVFLVAAYIAVKTCDIAFPYSLIIFLPAYAVASYDVLIDAVRGIASGEVFGEDTLMSVASIGALALGEYPEAVFVMLFNKIGSLFESVAVGKSRKSIKALTSMKPTFAAVETEDGVAELPVEEVKIGDVIVVHPGERVPVDGVIVEGDSALDLSALTGESLPVFSKAGDRVSSGAINKSGVLRIKAETIFAESTVSKIVSLVEESAATKAKSVKFITKFSRYYTPAVIIAALLTALIPSLVTKDPATWIKRALIFLVVSCPCALVISVPLSYFAGLGNAARRGILVKGSDHFETMASSDKFVFDKTGTVTEGKFRVTRILPVGSDKDELLALASAAESQSLHPLAKAITEEYSKGGRTPLRCESFEEIPGLGIKCTLRGDRIVCGNAAMMKTLGIETPSTEESAVHVAKNGEYVGMIELRDVPKATSKDAISKLKAHGCKTYILSGDKKEAAERVAREIGCDVVHSELLPAEKTERLAAIRSESDGKCAFIGDGINDAPSIAASDVGIAMGALGSDIAIECADVVLLDDDPVKVAEVLFLSKRVRRTVVQNIVFALAVKAAVLALGFFGLATMWEAALADVGVSVIAIINSMRLMRDR